MYQHRLATIADAQAIAPLWRSFLEARSQADPSMQLKPNFDLEKYVEKQLKTPNSYSFVAEHQETIIGFLFTYVYDEKFPLKDQLGNLLKTSSGLPVYSTPLRDPETQDRVFDKDGNLIVYPVLFDEDGNLIEYQEIPLFCPPLYERSGDKLILQQDGDGNYLFAEVEHNEDGTIKRSPDGKPMFKYNYF